MSHTDVMALSNANILIRTYVPDFTPEPVLLTSIG